MKFLTLPEATINVEEIEQIRSAGSGSTIFLKSGRNLTTNSTVQAVLSAIQEMDASTGSRQLK